MAARGGLLKLLDAYIAIGGDTSEFDKAVDQSEAKAKKAGGRIESAFSPRRVLGALGAAAGAVMGVMLTGANQLDAAARQLQADTGMTAAEAKVAEHALAGMYRNNLQGFDAIGAAMAAVHNDLGLIGKAADSTTEKFLKLTKVTKQDTSAAVKEADDTLDAFNLTADHAGELLDKLTISHQRYGGEISASQVALAKIAPALVAANMGLDDGIALLNLFNAAGVDASKAPQALAKALGSVESPEELRRLIADITATTDPFQRATKATALFGARAGPQLAQALAQGNLADFAISMNDAAGATDSAAEASLSWGDKWTLMLHKVGGTLAEFGTQFGPLLMVAAAFGPGLTKAIGAGLGGLAGILIPKVTAAVLATGPGAALAASGVGTTIGAAMGAAIPIALAAGLGLLIGGAIGMAIEGPIVDAAKKDMAAKVGTAISEAVTPADLEHMREVIQQGMEDMPTLLGWDIFGGKDALQAQLDEVDAEIARRAAELPATVAEGVTAGAPRVRVAVEDVMKTFGTSLKGVTRAWRQTGADGMAAMAAGITAARAKPLDAFETLKEMLKNAMTPTAEAARLAGQLTSTDFARGMKSKDPAVRAQTIAFRDEALARIGEIAKSSGPIGQKAMDLLAAGIKSKDVVIRNAANQAKNIVTAKLNETKKPAGAAGANAGAAFATGLIDKVTAALAQAAGITARFGPQPTPIPPAVPGGAVGTPFVPRDMLAFIHRGEMVIPAAASAAVRAGQAVVTGGRNGGGGGNTYNVNVTGLVKARDPLEIATQMRRLARFGVLTPRGVPA